MWVVFFVLENSVLLMTVGTFVAVRIEPVSSSMLFSHFLYTLFECTRLSDFLVILAPIRIILAEVHLDVASLVCEYESLGNVPFCFWLIKVWGFLPKCAAMAIVVVHVVPQLVQEIDLVETVNADGHVVVRMRE